MSKNEQEIQEILNTSAAITRKYNLGDREHFFRKFGGCDTKQLTEAWEFGLRKIQNREIIKDTSDLPVSDNPLIEWKVNEVGNDYQAITYYLNSGFDVRELKLKDENIERRVRHILAEKFLEFKSKEIRNLSTTSFSRQNSGKSSFRKKLALFFVISSIAGSALIFNISSGDNPQKSVDEKAISDSVVFICISPGAYAYHSHHCRGLNQCSHRVDKVKKSKAIAINRRPCKICY
jgi:hypothetical protein